METWAERHFGDRKHPNTRMSLAEAMEHIKDELVITLDMHPDLREAYQVIIEHFRKDI